MNEAPRPELRRVLVEGKITQVAPVLSHTIYYLMKFRGSTPPQNRLLGILISNSKQYDDDLWES